MKTLRAAYCVLVGLFLLTPLLVLVPLSFAPNFMLSFSWETLSVRQYKSFLGDSRWMESFAISIEIATISMCVATALGTLAGVVLIRYRPFGAAFFSGILLSPRFVPVIITALALYALFAHLGLIGSIWALIIAHTTMALPYVVILITAALRNFDGRLEDASRSLGAGPFTTVMRITLPLIRPALQSAALISFILSFDEVVIAIFVSGPRVVTWPKRMWDTLSYEMEPALPAIATTILLATSLLFVLLFWSRRAAEKLTIKTEASSGS